MITKITSQLILEAYNRKDMKLAVELLTSPDNEVLTENDRIKLSYIRFNSLDISRALALLQNSVLLAYEIPGFSLMRAVEQFLLEYNFPPDEYEFCRTTLTILKNNSELLHTGAIIVRGKKVQGSIGNLIDEYLANSSEDAHNRDALSLVNFLNKNSVSTVLTENKRKILRDILGLYNFCQQNVALWESIPDEISPEMVPPELLQENHLKLMIKADDDLLSPDLDESENQVRDLDINIPSQSIVESEQSVISPPDKLRSASLNSGFVPKPAGSVNPASINRVQNRPPVTLPVKDIALNPKPVPANLRKRGLIFDEPTNVKLEEIPHNPEEVNSVSSSKSKSAPDIAAKLQDLKQRKQQR